MGSAEPRGHTVEWRISSACWIDGTVTCHEPDTADCRTWCAEGCEERCTAPGEHRREPTGSCNLKDWLENGDLVECYAGPTATLVNGPVDISWDGDNYLWRYPPEHFGDRNHRIESRDGRRD